MSDINLKNALTQQLQSLHKLGVRELISAAGEGQTFDFSNATEIETQAAPTAPQPAATTPQTPLAKPQTPPAQPPQTSAIATPPTDAPLVDVPPTGVPLAHVPLAARGALYEGASQSLEQRAHQLAVIASEVEACQACPELCRSRSKTVFGVGNPESKVVFIGEGPRASEDRQGVPFVGEAGKLLDKILNASTLKRDQVYMLNAVKCRPPNDRNPLPVELANCRSFLDRQLDVIRPEYIVCLGSVAAKSLLNTEDSLGKLRKQFHQYRGSKVLVTYHPDYLLRTPSAKVHVWEDMKMLMSELGVEL